MDYKKIYAKEININGGIAEYIYENIKNSGKEDVVLVNVGTDLIVGDCLGPLIGSNVTDKIRNIKVYGTLDNLIHARNINYHIDTISKLQEHSYIIAIDSCIGNHEDIGAVILSNRPVKPGAAFRDDLPSVGDCSVKGVVSSNKEFSSFVSSVRLSLVFNIAFKIEQEILKLDSLLSKKSAFVYSI